MSVVFTVPGRVPSKSNYRHGRMDGPAWGRIVSYQNDVGMSAIAAGAKKYMSTGKAVVKMLLVNQIIDCDNAMKIIDGLKGIAFVDDGPKYLRGVQAYHADPDDSGPRVEFRIEWETA